MSTDMEKLAVMLVREKKLLEEEPQWKSSHNAAPPTSKDKIINFPQLFS